MNSAGGEVLGWQKLTLDPNPPFWASEPNKGLFGSAPAKELVKFQVDTVLERPPLEYCVQLCVSNLKKDAAKLEELQRRATRVIRGLENKH